MSARDGPEPCGCEQLGVDAEIAPELDPDAVLGGVGVEHRGYVVLDVAGGEQHARHGEHVVHASPAEPVQAFADGRPRELQKAALKRIFGQPRGETADQVTELLDRRAVARAVAAYHHPDSGHRQPCP
jgi:hypothetical protein